MFTSGKNGNDSVAGGGKRAWLSRVLAVMVLCAPLLVSVESSAAAQPALASVAQLNSRTVEVDGPGVESPIGLVYAPGSAELVVINGPADSNPSGVAIAGSGRFLGVRPIPAEVGGARNVAHDPLTAGLVLLTNDGSELVDVPADPGNGSQSRRKVADIGGVDNALAMTVASTTGDVVILNRSPRRLVVLSSEGGGVRPTEPTQQINLAPLGLGDAISVAVDPADGSYLVATESTPRLHRVSVEGDLQASYNLVDLDDERLAQMVVAPSADQTDPVTTMSVYALTEPTTDQRTAEVIEISLALANPVPGVPVDGVSLVASTPTSNYSPPSPDPSGIAYVPDTNELIISDGEVNEIGSLFTGDNLFRSQLSGGLISTGTTIPWSNEPTGVAYDQAGQRYFITDDTGDRGVFVVGVGVDGTFGTTDDVVSFVSTEVNGFDDPEGVAYDTARGHLFVADGVNEEILDIGPGGDGQFGTADDTLTTFDTSALGLRDPEGVEYDASTNRLLVLSGRDELIGETSTTGDLIRYLDISTIGSLNAAGLTLAPASGNAGTTHLYVVDRAVDNNNDPNENDGVLFEISFTFVANAPPTVDAGPDLITDIDVAINLDATVTDDGVPDPPAAVTTSWTVTSGPGSVTFGDPSAVDTTVSFDTGGLYQLRLNASDGQATAFDEVSVSVTGPGGQLTISVPVSDRADDAEERANGSVSISSSDLELVSDSGGNQTVGIRFAGVNVPQGATVLSSSVQFTVDETTTVATNLTVRGEDADNASSYAKVALSISSRPTTTASVAWSPPSWSTVGASTSAQMTPDLAAVVQEIVDRPGWVSGNPVAFVITGTGERVAESYNGSVAAAPVLTITYRVGNGPPSVDAGVDIVSSVDVAADLNGTVTDDGLPVPPGALTTLWSVDSGPAAVTFGDTSLVDTTASFTVTGTYVLRLTADDGELTASDTVTITVTATPANTPPSVDAGVDTASPVNAAANLNGTVTDDGLPAPPGATATLWSVDSGPAAVTFGDASLVDTTASFTVTGTYVLRLTADDGELTASDTVTITVTATPANTPPSVDAGVDTASPVNAAANLNGTVTDDGLPAPPGATATLWSVDSGPAAVTFGDASLVDTTASFTVTGTYVLRLTADDGELTAFDTVTITVTATAEPMTITRSIVASADDAEERSTGVIDLDSSDLELVHDRGGEQTVGMRFTSVNLPPGAVITSASVRFTVDEVPAVAADLTIQAEDADDATQYTATSFGISSRPRTAASVAWSPAVWTTIGASGPAQTTPDLAAVVQEVVNRPGWASGNALAVVITGNGERVAESFDGSEEAAAVLSVSYVVAGQQRPVVDAGPDLLLAVDETATLDATVTDDGLPNPPANVSTTWSQLSGPGTTTFGDPSAVDTTATFSAVVTYVLQIEANDGQLSNTDQMTVTVTGVGGELTLNVAVTGGQDDAEEDAAGAVGLGSSDLELVQESTIQTVGIRFNGLSLPQGATITSAYIQFTADETDSVATNLVVEGHAVDNAPVFLASTNNISARSKTAASVAWAPQAWSAVGAAGAAERTADLSPVVQELVDRPGWSGGNSIAFIVTGSGKRVAESHNGAPASAARLVITYILPG